MLQYNPKPGIIDWLWMIRRAIQRLWSRRKFRSYFRRPSPKSPVTSSMGTRLSHTTDLNLNAGDLVRVRSRAEIKAMLDGADRFKGYGFMEEMWQYCGTTHQVHKRVNQFLDERDYRVKKLGRTVLLEDAICEGTKKYGPCDRACYYFWREEWLERIG